MKRTRAALVIVTLLGILAAPAGGFHEPILVNARGAEIAEILINGSVVIRLRGATAPMRAAGVAEKLRRLDLTPSTPVAVQKIAGSPVITIGRVPILTVDRTQAAPGGLTPAALAAAWAQRLRQALAAPRVAVAPKSLSLVPGERAFLTVHIFPSTGYVVGKYDTRVITLRAVRGSGRPGRADIPVAVRQPAAALPRTVEVEVSGDPSDPQLVQEAIRHAVLRETRAHPGSKITVGTANGAQLTPGEVRSFVVPVLVRNPFARYIAGTVSASVRNVTVPLATPARLLVSNRPEVVTTSGVLFAQSLHTGEAVRLLYHHQNGAEQRKLVTITLTNPRREPARMHIIGAVAGPSTDLMFAGQAATSRFLQRLQRQQGYVIEVPPGRTHTFTVHEMPPGSLVSGLLQAQTLAGQLDLSVHIRSPWLLTNTITSEVNQPAYPHPHGTFHVSEFSVTRSVTAHEPVPLVNLGVAVGPVDPLTGIRLVGDYGIVYRLSLEVRNPSDLDQRVSLVATALGGAARGLFLIDNDAVDVGTLRPGEDRTLASITVRARDQVVMTVVTMPVAGSFYPVRLMLRPDTSTP
ncbi:MAG: hypothetical protein HYY39_01600 [Armatimonadetes bacterium]|nr:hypothetical protein [Armatimonadota bacterium]